MKICPVCGKERATIIPMSSNREMCIDCYFAKLKKEHPDDYWELVKRRHA